MGDEIIECVECGRTFTWSYGEQRYYKEHGLVPPKRCPACRSQRRSERHPEMRGFAGSPAWWAHPVYCFGLATFALTIALAAIIWWYCFDVLLSWLIAITLVTFLAYGYDKAIAGSKWTRVPEKVLLALTFAGGTIGALVGMQLFHHKTAKAGFRLKFWLVAIAPIVLIVAYYVLIRR